ncbi:MULTISPECIES: hypothetical protein [unclassified Burkholderia]|uniref:hypothetical protein n=1 Tax=unclassified Burkholderia TaxID=2613784 RepID=UPI00141FF3C8|nr:MULTISPECIES: hypothetical protein [unclassified Burkholderia]NIE83013.1 hypothetical protein [Burkholderia sp. Tr-860]NIF62130.1 hypothetical protein [Burkholderia sp. Cy-647]NIF96270.1 hypothetical protein [Burkholderia sp. Ax-1720]
MELSNWIALAAFAVSSMSALYTKKQSDIARVSLQNTYRAHVSGEHSRYRDTFRDLRKQHKDEIRKLSELAGEALTSVINEFDSYDIAEHAVRPLRHLLHESSEMVFDAFKGQLAWQSGANISMRFHHIVRIEDHLEPSENYFAGGDDRIFEQKYLADKNAYLESMLPKDRYFCSLVFELKSRIDPSRAAELLIAIQDNLVAFRSLHQEIAPSLREAGDALEELIEEGLAEHFPLTESPQLFSAMRRQRAILDGLSELRIPQIDRDSAHHYRNFVSLGIQACAVLHAVQGVHSWGWIYE